MVTNFTDSNDDRNNDHIPGRGPRRQNEIQQIKQLPIHALLVKRGFTAEQRKLSSAVFPDLPNIEGKVFVFLATKQRPAVWLAKYLDPDPMPGREPEKVTRTLIDLWGVLYHADKPVRERYPVVMAELRQIAGIGGAGTLSPKLGEAFKLLDEWDRLDPRGDRPQDHEEGVFSGGDDDRREQMRDRFHELTRKVSALDKETKEARKAKSALTAMAGAMREGNEKYFGVLAQAVEELTAKG